VPLDAAGSSLGPGPSLSSPSYFLKCTRNRALIPHRQTQTLDLGPEINPTQPPNSCLHPGSQGTNRIASCGLKSGPLAPSQAEPENTTATTLSQAPIKPPARRGEPEAHTPEAAYSEPLITAKGVGPVPQRLRFPHNGLCTRGGLHTEAGVCPHHITPGTTSVSQSVGLE
jgi:hypothetical protein